MINSTQRVPWTARRSNQSILKEINPEYTLEGLMLKRQLQYFGHLMWKASSLEKTLMLGKTDGRRRRGDRRWDGWMASCTQWTWIWANSGRQWRTGKPGTLLSVGSRRVGHDLATEQQQQRQAKHYGPCFWVMEKEPQMSFEQGSKEMSAMPQRIILTAQWRGDWRDWMGLFTFSFIDEQMYLLDARQGVP